MCPLFYNYFSIGATVKTHKPHKKPPTFSKTQNYPLPSKSNWKQNQKESYEQNK